MQADPGLRKHHHRVCQKFDCEKDVDGAFNVFLSLRPYGEGHDGEEDNSIANPPPGIAMRIRDALVACFWELEEHLAGRCNAPQARPRL